MIAAISAAMMRLPRHHVLIFHRVLRQADPMSPGETGEAWFRGLVAMLAKNFEIISLAESVRRAADGAVSRGSLSITFDDGYADNAEVAMPILQAFGVPATFFVASAYLDGGRMWNDSIIETCRRLESGSHEIDRFASGRITISDMASRREAAANIITAWKHLPSQQRQSLVDAFSRQVSDLPDDLMMTTAQLRKLADNPLATIGGHTRSHPILMAIDDDEAAAEIIGGRQDLEDAIQRDLTLFAYPNGKVGRDYGDRHAAMVREAGFAAAVATDWGTLRASTDRYAIPRFTPWHPNLARFSLDLLRCHYGWL